MPIVRTPLNANHLVLFVENELGIVFNRVDHCLYSLPTLSVAILFSIDQGESRQITLNTIAQQCQLPQQQLEPLYQEIKSLFTPSKNQTTYLEGRYPELAIPSYAVEKVDCANTAHYRVADIEFSVSTENTMLFDAICNLLSPCVSQNGEANFVITIVEKAQTFDILSNGLVVESNLEYHHVLPLIIDRLQILSFQMSHYTFCFHGAAIATEQGILLLPGKSGVGKSTLSAILATNSSSLFSDEIIAFNTDFQLCKLTLPIAVKSGSWNSLSCLYPNLADQPIWHRLDGRRLKYIWPKVPQEIKASTEADHSRFMIVNPQFTVTQDAKESLTSHCDSERLGVIDTISMLTGGGYQLGFELDEISLEAFMLFLARTPSYRVTYSNSQQALTKLSDLWQENE